MIYSNSIVKNKRVYILRAQTVDTDCNRKTKYSANYSYRLVYFCLFEVTKIRWASDFRQTYLEDYLMNN